jgi:hypothetical protein
MVRDLNAKEKALLAHIQAKPELESYFFKKLKGLHWLVPLYDKGYFSIENMPVPVPSRQEGYVQIPYWPASIYLSNISIDLSREENIESAKIVLDIIREVTSEAKAKDISNYKVWYQLAQAINHIPIDLIDEQDVSIIEYWLNDPYERGITAEEIGRHLLKTLITTLDKHNVATQILKVIFSVSYKDKKTGSYERKEGSFKINDYSVEKIIEEITPLIGDNLQLAGLELFESLITDFLDITDRDNWSSLWRNAIEDHEQNHSMNDPENYLINIFRDSLLRYMNFDPESSLTYVKSLIESKYIILKRIAIYAISENIETLSSLVPDIICNEYFSDSYRHEMWQFMSKNYSALESASQNAFLDFIESITVSDDEGKLDEGATAYKKSIWLSSIKDVDEELAEKYHACTTLAGTEPEYPDFTSYMYPARWVDRKSPIPLDELQKMELADLITTMDTTDEGDGFRESGRIGIIKLFRTVVKNKPEKIVNNLTLFLNKDLAYVHQIIEGFRELWNSKETLRWNDAWIDLLEFIQAFISNDRFWSKKNAEERSSFIANRHWIVGSISELIEDGVRNDEHAFSITLLPKAFEVINILLDHQEGSDFDISSDSVTTAINSPRGKCIEALINHALRSMRQSESIGKSKEEIWGQYVDIFNNELNRQHNGEYEFVTLVANYLPNFLYMSNEWVKDNLPNIFNKDNHQGWLSAFNGYSYVGTVYVNIYSFLRDNGHFIAALDDENLRTQVSDKIIQGAVVAYIHDFEHIEDKNSLLYTVINRKQYREIHQIIWFSWTQRKKADIALTAKIINLWPIIQNNINFESDDGKKIASDLCYWIVFVEHLNEDVCQLLYQIAPYVEYNHNSHVFLSGIHRLSNTYPTEAQQLWLRMLEEYSYAYPEDAIKGTLSNILNINKKQSTNEGHRLANQIIDAYLKHDQNRPRDWLNDLLDENVDIES